MFPYETELSKRRIALIRFRAKRKLAHAARCAKQAIAAKARLILKGKGANGRSMPPALLERHMNLR